MKSYLLFAGDNYYPGGGINDYQGDFDSFDEAKKFFESGYYPSWDAEKECHRNWDWFQIVQSSDMSTVENG